MKNFNKFPVKKKILKKQKIIDNIQDNLGKTKNKWKHLKIFNNDLNINQKLLTFRRVFMYQCSNAWWFLYQSLHFLKYIIDMISHFFPSNEWYMVWTHLQKVLNTKQLFLHCCINLHVIEVVMIITWTCICKRKYYFPRFNRQQFYSITSIHS